MITSFSKRGGRNGHRSSRQRKINRLLFTSTCFIFTIFVVGNVGFLIWSRSFDKRNMAGSPAALRQQEKSQTIHYQYLWEKDVEEPPEGKTCQTWLEETDLLAEERNFRDFPVRIKSPPAKASLWNKCPVGCVFAPDHGEAICDAILGRQDEPLCNFTVTWQDLEVRQLAKRTSSDEVIVGTSLDSDVPIGIPNWHDYPLMAPLRKKDAEAVPVLAILHHDCENLSFRMKIISEFRAAGVAVDISGACSGSNATSLEHQVMTVSRYRFAMLFEDGLAQDYLSPDYWIALSAGTVPLVVATGPLLKFAPADNAYLQVTALRDVRKVADWVLYLTKEASAYSEMLSWKHDWPMDTFLALLDLSVLPPECRLCTVIASEVRQREIDKLQRACRCWDGADESTVYHIFVRERGRLHYQSFFLRSDELTVSALIKAVYRVYRERDHEPLWRDGRPDALQGAPLLRAFRITPADATQNVALQGLAAFRSDQHLRSFLEATPCPQLEVIFL